jgi:hypothetical protein
MRIGRWVVAVLAVFSGFVLYACTGTTTPSDTPAPASTPAPTPTPALVTNTPGCKLALPKGTGAGQNCPRTSPRLMHVVEDAVITTREKNPSAYPLTDIGYQLTDRQLDAFFKDVVDHINAGGQACAYRDGLELAVKSTNAESEQYKFWVTSGHMRLGENSYRATCTPAWF